MVKTKTTIADAKTIHINSIVNVKNKKVAVDVTNKLRNVDTQSLIILKVVDVVITTQLLIVTIQGIIIQILVVTKVDMVGINNLIVGQKAALLLLYCKKRNLVV